MKETLKKYAQKAYARECTIQNTYDLTCDIILNNIDGFLVECGVAAGSQIGVMGQAIKDLNVKKQIACFDSFQGIPLAGKYDSEQPGIGVVDPNRHLPENLNELLVSSGIASHSLEEVKKNLVNWGLSLDNYLFYPGWFQFTTNNFHHDKIALLRLDGDLYESTIVCLNNMHHKVQKGGYVIVDDYALSGPKKAITDYFKKHNLNYHLIPVDPNIPEVHYYKVE